MPAAGFPRLRRDLTWRRFVMEGEEAYIFKDEITHEYLKLDAVSGTLALRLDGTVSPERLLEIARESWPSLDFDEDYIADVFADLKRLRFLEDPFERNAMVAARAREERAQINASTFKNLFSIPLGTVDPERFLARTYPRVAWFFQPFFVWLGLALFALSCTLVLLNRDHLAASAANLMLDERQRLLGAFLAWITIVVVIVIHELGHGYAVKHHGGRVHKMGFIFIFGLPCMFCDTSDSHLFPDRMHRVQVALAGTYTELYVATLATLVWWLTPPGLVVHQLAYNIMLFASVSGILFNYNPLIKMDGYFVLADLLDMPELQEHAYGYLGYLGRRYVLRSPAESPVRGRRRKWILGTYGVLSIVYSITFGILVFQLLRGRLIDWLAFGGALLSVLLLWIVVRRIAGPLLLGARVWALDHRGLIRRQLAPLAALGLALAVVFFLIPVSGRRALDATLEPGREAALLAPEELRLVEARFHAGQQVRAGELLAVLDADSAALDADRAAAEAAALRVTASAAQRRGDAAQAAAAWDRAAFQSRGSELSQRRARRAELRSPFPGRVLTMSRPEEVGRRLEPGDTVCVVGDLGSLRAAAVVGDLDVEDIEIGAPVRMRLRAAPTDVVTGRITGIEPLLSGDGPARYRVWMALDGAPASRPGSSGRAWLTTPRRTPASHVIRAVARFVRLDLWV